MTSFSEDGDTPVPSPPDSPPAVISAGSLGAYDLPEPQSQSPARSQTSHDDDHDQEGVGDDSSASVGATLRSPSVDSTGPSFTGYPMPTVHHIHRASSPTKATLAMHMQGLSYNKPPNQALIFIKPHANNDSVAALVESTLLNEIPGCKVLVKHSVNGERIARKRMIDRHYQAIARYATEVEVDQLNFDVTKFDKHFKGDQWAKVLVEERACNAVHALGKYGCDPTQLEKAWREAEAKSQTVKLAPGMYCGLVGINDKSLYVINGFYMAMRSKFIGADKEVRCWVIQWDEREYSWSMFRKKIVGSTDPNKAEEHSLRWTILKRYQELGLDVEPSTGNNGVHASASPLEGLAERCNWLSRSVADDDFGSALLGRGIPLNTILQWMEDPTVTFPPSTKDGSRKSGSLFDDVEDMDSFACMERLVQIYDDELFGGSSDGCRCVVS